MNIPQSAPGGMPPPHMMMPNLIPQLIPGLMTSLRPPRIPSAAPPTEPCQTIYVRNLHEKRKTKVLESALRTVFSEYGTILNIKVKRNVRMRGQGFITFDNIESATKALEVKGFPLFGKPLDVQYARDRAFVLSERDGTLAEHKARREEIKATREPVAPKKPRPEGATGQQHSIPDEYLPPNNILFVQNLPPETSEQILASLFNQFPGFKEVRLVPGRSDIAFVEYDSEITSATAKAALHGFKVSAEKLMKVTFAKK
ncbi:U2 small nuclear ribonucleoprotein B'' [Rhizophlyctis rosea]|uniref:U2 small nuclear ribonucleoprotein B n=1 Tax=Rhizophlyctis rosea TaxID=64517 RepID=A0AAD5SIQ8_9FUNG|nr:U2 small nuclear ribonucleoprotein B'' [Rhizophlyctis rosea]